MIIGINVRWWENVHSREICMVIAMSEWVLLYIDLDFQMTNKKLLFKMDTLPTVMDALESNFILVSAAK